MSDISYELAVALEASGKTNKAINEGEYAVQYYKELDLVERLADATFLLGRLYIKSLDYDKARLTLKDTLRYYKHLDNYHRSARIQEALAQLAIRTRGAFGFKEALERYQEAAQLYTKENAISDLERIADIISELKRIHKNVSS